MAYARDIFKIKLKEAIGGALTEFYKAECARANRLSKEVRRWTRETDRLLELMVVQVYLHPVRLNDRRKALAEALRELRGCDTDFRKYAMNQVARDCQPKKPKHPIPSDATDRFYQLVEEHIQATENQPPLENA
jgi:hypothetical protein